MMCGEWYLVDTCENVCDTSMNIGQSYVDLREMNEHNSVEGCMFSKQEYQMVEVCIRNDGRSLCTKFW
jgi:hypothetical protein